MKTTKKFVVFRFIKINVSFKSWKEKRREKKRNVINVYTFRIIFDDMNKCLGIRRTSVGSGESLN